MSQKKPERVAVYTSNNSTSKISHDARSLYSLYVDRLAEDLIDFWTKDRLYGRVTPDMKAIIPRTDRLRQIKYTTGNRTIFLLNFVADAWEELVLEMRDYANRNRIVVDSPWAKLLATKGLVDANIEYDNHLKEVIFPPISDGYLAIKEKNEQVVDFKGFLKAISPLLKHIAKDVPITRTGFIQSKYCPVNCSGLVVEISDDLYSDDFPKLEKYINDNNFLFFKEVANKHGFMIDKNAPWRLIAKIGSSKLERFMNPYGISSLYEKREQKPAPTVPSPPNYLHNDGLQLYEAVNEIQMQLEEQEETIKGQQEQIMEEVAYQNVFQGYFYKAHESDPESLKNYLMHWYNSYVSANQYITKPSFCEISQETRTVEKIIKPVEKSEVDLVLNSRNVLNLYFHLRARETAISMTAKRSKVVFSRIESILKYKGYDAALSYINQLFCGIYAPKNNRKKMHGAGYNYGTYTDDLAMNEKIVEDKIKKKSAHEHFGSYYNKKNIKDSY